MDEFVIFENAEIKITNLRAVVGNKTYSVANIISVDLNKKESSGCASYIFLFLATVTIGMGIIDLAQNWEMLILGAFFFFIFYKIYQANTSVLNLKIFSASGEDVILSTTDKSLADNVLNALNDAIVKKSK